MHQLTTAIFLIVMSSVRSASFGWTEESIYERILKIKNDPYKCPYLRETLLKPDEFDFLHTCKYTTRRSDDQLCVLYYNNFMELCYYSNERDIKTLLNDSTVKASIAQPSVKLTCESLNTSKGIFPDINKTIEGIVRKLDKDKFCEHICTGIENDTLPICIVTGLIRSVSAQVLRMPLSVKIDKKTENITQKPENITKKHDNITKKIAITTEEVKEVKKVDETVAEQITDKSLSEAPGQVKPEAPKEPPKGPQAVTGDAPKVNAGPADAPKVTPESVEKITEKVEVLDVPEKVADVPSPAEVGKRPEVADPEFEQETPYTGSQEDEENNDDIKEDAPEEKDKLTANKPKHTFEEHSIDSDVNSSSQNEEEDSFFFMYFMVVCAVFIIGYIGYHNKQKVLALVIEGRRGKRSSRRGGRPNSANYHKLDSNLEEAVTSAVQKNPTNVIY